MRETLEMLEELLPDKSISLNDKLKSVGIEISEIMEELNKKMNEVYENREFDKVLEYTECAKMLGNFENQFKDMLADLNNKDKYNVEEELNAINKKEKTLEDNLQGKKLVGIKFLSEEVEEVDGWKDLYEKTCQLLFDIDEEKMKSFIEMDHMNGNSRDYFSSSNYMLKKPIKLSNEMYIETNLISTQIKDIIINMLKEYRFDVTDFKVYIEN